MASSGPLYPGTIGTDSSVGTATWTSTSNIGANDNSTANCQFTGDNGQDSEYIKGTNFGFSIPSGATIDGIIVEVGGNSNIFGTVDDHSVRLVKGGTIGGDNKASGTDYTTSETNRTYGSSSDLWGLSFTDSDINNSTFGVVYSGNRVVGTDNLTLLLDYIRITVHYTEGASTAVKDVIGCGVIPFSR